MFFCYFVTLYVYKDRVNYIIASKVRCQYDFFERRAVHATVSPLEMSHFVAFRSQERQT